MRRLAALPALLLASALLLPASPAAGQSSYFGQNSVQYREFDWKILKTEHFDVHYYPELAEVAVYTGRMAERSYARLSRVLGHEFRERKPIIIYGSRAEFAQSNVLGDLGEGTGGATDPLRQRNMFFFAGDLGEAEHVLTHEMVHVFQFDIFGRGRAGAGLQTLSQVDPSLWYMEGMAEYLTNGPNNSHTDAIMRDAALNGDIPTVEQMTRRPDMFFPYRFGESLWRYVGGRWGDEVIGEIMQATPGLGIDRAFRRHIGMDLEELGAVWKEEVQKQYLPQVAELDRPRSVAQAVLNEDRTGGVIPVYIAPSLSPDGRTIAYISTGSLLRAEVFLDLYLADATTGKRIKRVTKSTLDPDFEELRFGYSQSAFSPDGRLFAFTAQRQGRDVLYLYDIRRERVVRRLDTGLQAMMNPSFSPDGRQIVFSGAHNGMSDLFVIDADGKNLRQLTDDPYGDMQPQWSPDGRYVAFASERGPQTDLETLRIGPWRISVYDFERDTALVIEGQDGHNLNPMWAPDGRSVAFISDRTGIPQIFLHDLDTREHYQLTKFVGGVLSMTARSPAMTWARPADKLAFTYQDDGNFTIWSIINPRQLKKEPFVPPAAVVADAPRTAGDSAAVRSAQAMDAITELARTTSDSLQRAREMADPRRRSLYLGANGWRPTSLVPAGDAEVVSVAALLDSATLALPDTTDFKRVDYKGALKPEYVLRPQVGYAPDNFGRSVYGATAVVLTDLVGDKRLVLAGGINGRISEAQLYAEYSSLGRRRPYSAGLQLQPYFFLAGSMQQQVGPSQFLQTQVISRYLQRTAFATGQYPLNRFTRFEYGASFTNIDRSNMFISQFIDFGQGASSGWFVDSIKGAGALNYTSPFVAYVSDNTLFGATGGIYGRRYRFMVEQITGSVGWTQYSMDYRRYDAILFNFLTLATRLAANVSVGPDEESFPKYIGRPDFIRGYDREFYAGTGCGASATDPSQCAAAQLLGSRVAYANIELRFPLLRSAILSFLPVPPVDGLVFYDFGMAWSGGQSVSFSRPDDYDFVTERYPLRSYGAGIRLNLFNFALVRWDYAVPRDGSLNRGYWTWSLGQSF
ncbi:MAG TPA: hypothetical protein VFM71_04420 [Gemmatimonadaceae bacterium]|nr:hypothetical protein [Gemmatimonadaceae bacterium]